MVRFVNTGAAQRITAYPRAVYRIVIQRAPGAWLSFVTGTLRWRRVVEDVINGSANPAAFALGGNLAAVLDGDTVATLDFQAKSTATTATVADLVNAVEAASPYANVVSVERIGPVPGYSAGGPEALETEREQQQDAERERAQSEGPAAMVAGALRTTRTVLIVAVIVAAAVAAANLIPRRSAGAP